MVAALGISLPNLLVATNPLGLGDFTFCTVGNVVVYADPQLRGAGIAVGDRIDYSRMPPNERYGTEFDGLRKAPLGKRVAFVVERHGQRHVARLAPRAIQLGVEWTALLQLTAQKAVFLVLVLLASALVLIQPTRLTTAFFLFAAGNGVSPYMYSPLPAAGYAAITVVDDVLAGLGVIGFLLLALYLDPRLQIRSRTIAAGSALLLALIVVPLATSDVLELAAGTRPAWALAGWTSFLAVWTCYVTAFVLLIRLTLSAATPRLLRLLAALLATVGALTILNWTITAQTSSWYFANLPSVAMNRGVVATVFDVSELSGWQLVARLTAVLAIAFAVIRGGLLAPQSRWLRLASYAGLGVAIAAMLLPDDNWEFVLRLLGTLLAFYVIIRAEVTETGPAFRRIAAYVIVALLAIAVFMSANVALTPVVRSHALIVPFEILAAVGIGYWMSGLRDLAVCLGLASVGSWNAWAKGQPIEERDTLAHSLGLAERTRRRGIITEVRAHAAFSAWRNGEEAEVQRAAGTLQHRLNGSSLRGIRGFALALTSPDNELQVHPEDLPEWKARAELVLCAKAGDAARAKRFAMDALASAERARHPALQVLASIAVAETCPERRSSSLERAHAIARESGWPALSKSILALRANARDIGLLQPFVDARLRRRQLESPAFEVSFFKAELCQNARSISLTEKQLELLFAVASVRRAVSDEELIDSLWPESDGDAARNSLRVCLHGLRKNAGDARIVVRLGKGFALHPWADVDLWRFQSHLSACRKSGGREGAAELRAMCETLREGKGRRATLGAWFYRFEQMLNRKLDEAERLLV